MRALALLLLLAACKGGGGGAATGDGRFCASQRPLELEMIPEMFHDNYALSLDGCDITIRNLDTGCTRHGELRTRSNNKSADLDIYNKVACADGFSDEQVCTFYKNADDEYFFGCLSMGIDAYFLEVL